MKSIIFIFASITFGTANAQYENILRNDTSTISYKDATGVYKIQYVYNLLAFSVPAVLILDESGREIQPPRHYFATITVFKGGIRGKCKWDIVGRSFSGQYVPEGCWEDIPSEQVKKAKSLVTPHPNN